MSRVNVEADLVRIDDAAILSIIGSMCKDVQVLCEDPQYQSKTLLGVCAYGRGSLLHQAT